MFLTSRKQNGTFCLAYNCKHEFDKNDKARFHSVPLKNEELFKGRLVAMRHVDFIPTKQSRISGDYFISSAYYPSSRMMLKTSVPSVFDFPQHLRKVVSERRQLKKNPAYWRGDCEWRTIFFKQCQTFTIKSRIKSFYSRTEEGNKAAAKKDKISAKKDDSLSGLLIDFKKKIE